MTKVSNAEKVGMSSERLERIGNQCDLLLIQIRFPAP